MLLLNDRTFPEIALQLFRFQAAENPVYNRFISALQVAPERVSRLEDIPFLPIRFFKDQLIKTGTWNEVALFQSSGTTGTQTSRHAVYDVAAYHAYARQTFENQFGSLKGYHVLALLPSYLERGNSSLVSMIDHFIKRTESPHSGFYLHNTEALLADVERLRSDNRKVLVWGVTYALLDIAEQFSPDWSHVLIFETGGMKGRRKEITRGELHELLVRRLKVGRVCSEYGMTELLSQAYTTESGQFEPAKTMRIIIRDLSDPFRKGLVKETGAINVIDLANFSTIAFIETEDIGKLNENGLFEVLGRVDNSDIRGCNLLVE